MLVFRSDLPTRTGGPQEDRAVLGGADCGGVWAGRVAMPGGHAGGGPSGNGKTRRDTKAVLIIRHTKVPSA